MKSETMRWWMDVFQRSMYKHFYAAIIGLIIAGLFFMLKNAPYRVPVIVFGASLFIVGIVACFMTGTLYDRLNKNLRAVELKEKKEKKKEEKNARKPKTD